jgi:hypothetical protein
LSAASSTSTHVDKDNIVEFSNAHEMLDTWRDDADEHGVVYGDSSSRATAADAQSNGVSLLVTRDHMMYAQWGKHTIDRGCLKLHASQSTKRDADGKQKNAPGPYAKVKAEDLLAYSDDVGVRMLAAAAGGVGAVKFPPALNEAFASLHIDADDSTKLDFLHVFGYWLGNGSFRRRGDANAVHFTAVKPHDVDWLLDTLKRLGLTEGDMSVRQPTTSADEIGIDVDQQDWVAFFEREYGHKYGQKRDEAIDANEANDLPHVAVREDGVDKVKVADAEAMRQLLLPTATPIVCVPTAHAATTAASAAAARAAGFDFESTAAGSKMQPESIESAKWFPSWAWQLGQREMRALIDGVRRVDAKWAQDEKVVWTSSVRFRDELVRMLLMAGYTARFRCEYTAGSARGTVDERVVVARHDSWAVMYAENDNTPAGSKLARPVLFKARGELRERDVHGPRVVLHNAVGLCLGASRAQERGRRRDKGVATAHHRKLRHRRVDGARNDDGSRRTNARFVRDLLLVSCILRLHLDFILYHKNAVQSNGRRVLVRRVHQRDDLSRRAAPALARPGKRIPRFAFRGFCWLCVFSIFKIVFCFVRATGLSIRRRFVSTQPTWFRNSKGHSVHEQLLTAEKTTIADAPKGLAEIVLAATGITNSMSLSSLVVDDDVCNFVFAPFSNRCIQPTNRVSDRR